MEKLKQTQKRDYSRYLVLYSGGADSTYFIENEKTAKYLIFFEGHNEQQRNVAITNANLLNRHLNLIPYDKYSHDRDGETNEIHALYDTKMALEASIIALSYGMKGIVMCFNADDIGIDYKSIENIVKRVDKNFEILLPLINISEKDIRSNLKNSKLKTISCMNGDNCGYCAKCLKNKSIII